MGWEDDFTFRLYTPSKLHSVEPAFVDGDRDDLSGFCSIYAVDKKTAHSIQQAGTTISYKGVVWAERLWLDTDSYEAADAVEAKLKEMDYAFISYDSGGRGAHFGIALDMAPSHTLPYQCKAWAAEHFGGLADTSIYTHLHLFRLPGTVHERTGRRKTLVDSHPGRALVLPRWEPKHKQLVSATSNNARSIFDNFRVMSNSLPARNGERHAQLIRLIYALKDGQGLDSAQALWWANQVNLLAEEPKDEADIEKAILSIYRS